MHRSLADRIASSRKQKGWTQAQLAARVGVNHMTVWRWENDKTAPSGRNLERLAEVFDW